MLRQQKVYSFAVILLLAIVSGDLIEFQSDVGRTSYRVPAGSMKPTIPVGSHIFVSEFEGISERCRSETADFIERGDIVVFYTKKDRKTPYVKRLVGIPGDRLQLKGGVLYLNGEAAKQERIDDYVENGSSGVKRVARYRETLPSGVSYEILSLTDNGVMDNTRAYEVPQGHYFMMGDNRDNSTDSRVLSQLGYIPCADLIGKIGNIYNSRLNPYRPYKRIN